MKTIKIGTTNKQLSSHAGLALVSDVVKSLKLREFVDSSLPQLKSGSSRSWSKFNALCLGLATGAECLDDMDLLGFDPGFVAACDETSYTPKTYGDFLRSFTRADIKNLQESLMNFAFVMRHKLKPDDRQIVFDIDSTVNIQYGKKMQGVKKNKDGKDCLDTLNVFDDLGLQYYLDVREGATHTSQSCEEVIHKLMLKVDSYSKKYGLKFKVGWRGDSGYYTSGFMNACFAKGADFVLCVKKDEHHFPKVLGQIHNWQAASCESGIKFYDGREVEIGSTSYRYANAQRNTRYVVMRTRQKPDPLFPGYVAYDYYAFTTTYSEDQFSNEELILFYRKRGNGENFIKENKYGFDLKHYPCLKLDANRAYGLHGAFAYNLTRYLCLKDNPDKPYFVKKLRFKLFHLPSLVARTGGYVKFRFMQEHIEEVSRWFKLIHNLQLELA